MVRGKFRAQSAYTRKEERSKIKSQSFHLRKLEKEEQIKPKLSRRKEIIRIRAEIMNLKTGNQQRKSKLKAGSLKRSIQSISL